jgi:carboxymethylenebutenolidase
MPTAEITVTTLDRSVMPAFVAWPEGAGQWPTAVVLGELFGLTDVQRKAAEQVAAIGYVAIAPDLLHRRAPGGPLPEDHDGRAQALALLEELTRLELISDVRDALAAAKMRGEADPQAPSVSLGVSFGGHVALLAAATLGFRACVAMYAGWLTDTGIAASRPEPTGQLPFRGRLLILAGETDPMVPAADVDTLRGWQPDAEIVTYPGAGHRFCSVGRPGYNPQVAADAWARTGHFLSARAGEGDDVGSASAVGRLP